MVDRGLKKGCGQLYRFSSKDSNENAHFLLFPEIIFAQKEKIYENLRKL
jgi:hypothetical protein